MHLDVVWDTLYGKYTSQRQLSYGMLFVLFLPLWVKSSFHRYFTLHTYMHSVAYQENSKGGGWLPYMVKTIIFHMVDAVEFDILHFSPQFLTKVGSKLHCIRLWYGTTLTHSTTFRSAKHRKIQYFSYFPWFKRWSVVLTPISPIPCWYTTVHTHYATNLWHICTNISFLHAF